MSTKKQSASSKDDLNRKILKNDIKNSIEAAQAVLQAERQSVYTAAKTDLDKTIAEWAKRNPRCGLTVQGQFSGDKVQAGLQIVVN